MADRIDRVGMGWVFKGGSSSEGSLLRKRGVCFRREGLLRKGGKGSSLERGGKLLWKGEVFSEPVQQTAVRYQWRRGLVALSQHGSKAGKV